jgi:hypothetical protein
VIFSRGKRTAGRHARQEGPRSSRPEQAPDRASAEQTGAPGQPDAAASTADPSPPTGDTVGPYDISEVPAGVRRLDLGSLQIPSVTGVQVRVQANQDGIVQRVVLVHGKSALQLAAFAAPRTEPIWDEVRADISKSLFAEGVAVQEVDGEYGIELRARMRTKEGMKDLRFVGVDGPRWLVRADFQGPAAVDPAAVPQLAECLRGLVVNRGPEAKPAKEPLPLRLPEEMSAQVQQQTAAASRAGEPLPPPSQPVGAGPRAGRRPSPRPVIGGPNGAEPAAGGS